MRISKSLIFTGNNKKMVPIKQILEELEIGSKNSSSQNSRGDKSSELV